MTLPNPLLAHFDDQVKAVRSKVEADTRLAQERDPDADRRASADELLDAFLDDERAAAERKRAENAHNAWLDYVPRAGEENPVGKTILKADPRVQVAIVRIWFERTLRSSLGMDSPSAPGDVWRADRLINRLFLRKLLYSEADTQWILSCLLYRFEATGLLIIDRMNVAGLFRSLARSLDGDDLSEETREMLRNVRRQIAEFATYAAERKIVDVIDGMLGTNQDTPLIDTADDWGHYAARALAGMEPRVQEPWKALLELVPAISGTRPSKSWLKNAGEQISLLGEETFVDTASAWLGLLGEPTRGVEYRDANGWEQPSAMIAETNSELLKGVVWACSTRDEERIALALGDAALACYKKIPNWGARSTKAGNACVYALGATASLPALGQLQRIRQRVKLASQRNAVEEALAAAANERGLNAKDLDELFVSRFDLEDGIVRRDFGDFTAELIVSGSNSVDLRWLKPDGKTQKTVPAEVKREHADDVKTLKRTQRELREALTAQRARIERLMLDERDWSFADWRERYLDHPLMSVLVRRLLWNFEQDGQACVGGWLDGEIVGLDDQALAWISDDTRVRIWHPIEAEAGEVLAWRAWLERHAVTQPFKQAHREIYVLTDAERETETYSNRFAAHIIRQHQFNALCQQRGWRYQLQGAWDGFNVPTLSLHGPGLRAEYWVEGIEQGEGSFSHAGIYLYASTDQVRFADLQSGESIPLEEVPTRILSEVMRDVDLFVGVASIGADPHWLDGGADRLDGHQGYWWDYSFGKLTARAEVRRETLARLLPRMAKLESRWELDGRFLNVQGDLRGYKIHLGSGNILMEPNDQYLCIVPSRGARGNTPGDGLFLPFEGDQTLAVILSKALMLAADTKIKDPTIKRQIAT